MMEMLTTTDLQGVIIWGAAIVLIAAATLPYYLRYRRRHAHSVQRLDEARQLGIDKARAQFPQIDESLCIGCGSCVRACPESDVLAVIHGIAVVVNGQRCVGHARCEEACPVGALTVGLGDLSGREDIPRLTESYESSVPGLYIAGELGGISLIRNAIAQGRSAIEQIAATLEPGRDRKRTDVVIVGAGPAGLTAALTAIESGLTYVVLERSSTGGTIAHYPRRKLVMTQPVDIPLYGRLKKEEYSKESLLEIWTEIVKTHNVDIRNNQDVVGLHRVDGGFIVKTRDHEHFGRYVVLCLGRRGTPRKLGVPGEELPKVVYQLMDAQSFTGRRVLVVGGGDSAVEAAIALARQPDTDVTISYRKNGFPRIKKKNEDRIGELINSGLVRPIFESNVQSVEADSVALSTPDGTVTIPNDDVIVLIGGVPPFAMLKEMGIEFGGEESRNSVLIENEMVSDPRKVSVA